MLKDTPETPTIKPGTLYRHFKGGLYRVDGIAQHSEGGESLVIYRHMSSAQLWARPITMWTEVTDRWSDGVSRPRFVPAETVQDVYPV